MKTTSYLKRRGIDPEDFSQELALATFLEDKRIANEVCGLLQKNRNWTVQQCIEVASRNRKTESELRTIALRNCLRLISGGKRSRVPSEALPDQRDTPPAVAEDSPELYEVWQKMPFRDLVASAMEHEENQLPPVVRTACKRHLEREAIKPQKGDWSFRARIWYAIMFGRMLDHVPSARPKTQYMPRAEVRADAARLAPFTSRDLIERLTQWKPQQTAPQS